MRTRWDEIDEAESGSGRFLGFSAVTWSLAVPVAFIAGAAITSFISQPSTAAAPLAIPAPVASGTANAGTEARVASEKSRWEEEAREATAKAAELQMQLEAVRDQVSDETRRRKQAEQAVAQKTQELDRSKQIEAAAAERPATAVAVSTGNQQAHDALAYTSEKTGQHFGGKAEIGQQIHSAPAGTPSGTANVRSSDDSIALQRIIEDTASRSAALSDRRDEVEEVASQTASVQTPKAARRDSAVETALGSATGLDSLSATQRSSLKTDLVSGACVSSSLEKVFGNPVPVVPLRNLVRDLDSDC